MIKVLAIIIPVLDEQQTVGPLIDRCVKACTGLGRRFKIILVDDGSTDDSVRLMREKVAAYPGLVKVLVLGRNHGQHHAVMCGFRDAMTRMGADAVVTIDADLQNPPEEIPRVVGALDDGHDVVGTVRVDRQDTLLRRIPSTVTNFIVRRTTGIRMSDYGCMLRGYRRPVVEAMLACTGKGTFIPVLANRFARRATEIPVSHAPRAQGESRYGLLRLMRLQLSLLATLATAPRNGTRDDQQVEPPNETDATRLEWRRSRTSVLILGVNGFIGNALGRRLLASGRYEVSGMDIRSDNIGAMLGQEGFRFCEGDISNHQEWVDDHIRECDIIVPLVAVATPIEYMRNPLKVFELGFEQNLRIVRVCARFGKRLVFPSTSEVYGMCEDDEFDEDASNMVMGPIERQRWIYACSKQLLDRVIWAYGAQHDLPFTLFRPFNWIGPRLDSLDAARIGSSRVVTQLILALVEGKPIQLVDGGRQRRCFTDVADGVECLYRIIENDGGRCNGQIINIGHPGNELSIRDLARMLVELFEQHPLRDRFPQFAGFQEVAAEAFYGPGYQDIERRRPSIRNARRLLGWSPRRGVREAVAGTLDFFLRDIVGRDPGKRVVDVETKPAAAVVAQRS